MKKIILCIMIIMDCHCLMAQSIHPDSVKLKVSDPPLWEKALKNVVPSSPQSRLFEQYIDIPEVAQNGTAEIDIPLYEITVDGLSIPISIKYRATGIKYKQYDGDIGAGWILDPGYRVTRNMCGDKDEYDNMPENIFSEIEKRKEGHYRDRYLASFLPYNGGYGPLSEDHYYYDSEYDQFRYMLPGGSGHFIITDRKKYEVEILENHNDIIKLYDGSPRPGSKNIEKVQITDANGFIYHFGTGIDGIQTLEQTKNFYSAWLLKDIQSPTGKNIKFDYRKSTIYNKDMSKQMYTIYDWIEHLASDISGSPVADHPIIGAFDYSFEMAFVDRIITDKEIVEFVRSKEDIVNNKYFQVDEIRISSKNTGKLVRKIIFHRKKNGPHWLLTGIDINGDSEGQSQKYTFEYREPSIKFNEYAYYADQWGYYKNGGTGVNNWKGYYHKEFELDRYVFNPLKIESAGKLIEGDLKDKSQNKEVQDIFTLKKIHFPTGGWRYYEYEPHKYKNSKGIVDGGGIRISKIYSYDGISETMTQLYEYGINEDGIGVCSFDVNPRQFADESCFVDYQNNGNTISYFPGSMRRYSTEIIGDASIDAHFSVNYPAVAIYQYDERLKKYSGKTVDEYILPETYNFRFDEPGIWNISSVYWDNMITNENSGLYIEAYRMGLQPVLSSKKIFKYDPIASKFDLIFTTIYTYKPAIEKYFTGLKIIQKVFTNTLVSEDEVDANTTINPYRFITSFYDYFPYTIVTGRNNLLENKKEISHNSSGDIINSAYYKYNGTFQLIGAEYQQSSNINRIEEYKYPSDFSTVSPYKEMVGKNIISPVIESTETVDGVSVSVGKTSYKDWGNNLFLPETVQQGITSSSLEPRLTYHNYDSKGNPLYVSKDDAEKVVYLWGYNYQYPIAEIKGASYSEVKTALGNYTDSQVEALAAKNPSLSEISTLSSALRTYSWGKPVLVTTYTYKPLVGMTSMTDPSRVTTTYEYDLFGRLQTVKDMNGNILNHYDYHYQKN